MINVMMYTVQYVSITSSPSHVVTRATEIKYLGVYINTVQFPILFQYLYSPSNGREQQQKQMKRKQ